MNRLVVLLTLLMLYAGSPLVAQLDRGIPYQALLRQQGQSISQTDIDVRFSLFGESALMYQESHAARTTSDGLFSLVIGEGEAIYGTWEQVQWAGPLSLRVEINAGNGWETFGETELNAVPTSFYAETAGSVQNMSIDDLTDVFINATPQSGYTLKWNGSHWIPGTDFTRDDDDDPANELQSLSLEGNVLTLSRQGGSVTLPGSEGLFSAVNGGISFAQGKVGIGTASPQEMLHVSGSIVSRDDTSASGYQFMWDTDRSAFRAGLLDPGQESLWAGSNVGTGSFAVNHATKASGQYASAFGDQTQANGTNSFAGGLASIANGDGAFAFGYTNYATGLRSVAMGQSSMALGNYTVAMGQGAQARGIGSISLGEGTVAMSAWSAAFGRFNAGTGLETQWRDADPILEIGNGQSAGSRSNALTVLKSGRIGIAPGTQAPAAQLHVFQQQDSLGGGLRLSATTTDAWELLTRGDSHLAFYQNGHLRATVDPATGGWLQMSDARLKEDIMPLEAGLDELMNLRPVSYRYTSGDTQQTWGFLAQEVQQLFPELVREQEGRLGLSYQEFSVLAVKAIQEQQEIMEAQEARIRDLEERLSAIEQSLKP